MDVVGANEHSKCPLGRVVANRYFGIHSKLTNSQFVPQTNAMFLREWKDNEYLIVCLRTAALKLVVQLNYRQFHGDA